jgi:hypothetical protein
MIFRINIQIRYPINDLVIFPSLPPPYTCA